jgi:hypothetical protein
LFDPNVLSCAVQYDYEKCPDRYFSFLQLKAEFFASDGVQLWNMAVVEEILRKLPSHERLIWHVFENIQLGYVKDWHLKDLWYQD